MADRGCGRHVRRRLVFLRNTLGWDIGDLDWDAIWPIIVIAIGVSILAGAARHARGAP